MFHHLPRSIQAICVLAKACLYLPSEIPSLPADSRALQDVLSTDSPKDPRREEAIEYLLERINYERTPVLPYNQRQLKLDRMRQLLIRLGNPDAGLPIVHVAGTKGKGSTSALVGSILHAAGYEVGLFSSPHLERIEERFAINGVPCTADELVALVDQLRPVVTTMDREAEKSGDSSLSPTYFELTTAVALMYFAQRKVDVAVLEVGLGGRLDSTNVCQPAVTVISSISFDHTKQLGDTLAEIAAEKAGIIKPGVPVLCGPLLTEPREVIAEIAQQHGCRMIEAGVDFRHEYRAPQALDREQEMGQLDYSHQEVELKELPLQLVGEHQAANAALAVSTCLELRRQGWSIDTVAIREGLAGLSLPARLEIVRRQPTVVLDVAHNVASAHALVNVLQSSFAAEERILVLAVSKDKDVPGIVRALLPCFDHVIATEYRTNPRAVPTAQLGEIIREEIVHAKSELREPAIAEPVITEPVITECGDPHEAYQQARKFADASPEKQPLICVTGSFFIAAELRQTLSADV